MIRRRKSIPPEPTKDQIGYLATPPPAPVASGGVGSSGSFDPYLAAQLLLNDYLSAPPSAENGDSEPTPLIRIYRGLWYHWSRSAGGIWAPLEERVLKARSAVILGQLSLPVSSEAISSTFRVLQGLVQLPDNVDPPMWLTPSLGKEGMDAPWLGQSSAHEVQTRSGILNLVERTERPATPRFFTPAHISVPYAPESPWDSWDAFLRQVFSRPIPDAPPEVADEEIALLQEWFGYCLTSDTSHQRFLLMEGPPRSGKGTILRVLSSLLGPQLCIARNFGDLGAQFGLEDCANRTLITISDATIGRSGRGQSLSIERFKSIIGEDEIAIHRKFLPPLSLRLRTRIIIAVNTFPMLRDSSMAIVDRLLVLSLRHTWTGREDLGLFPRLKSELSGILNWALVGLSRLRAQGHFTKVAAEDIEQRRATIMEMTNPFHAFFHEKCSAGASYEITIGLLWDAWVVWCRRNGHKPGSKQFLTARINALLPAIRVVQTRLTPYGERQRAYRGVTLTSLVDPRFSGRPRLRPRGTGGVRGAAGKLRFDTAREDLRDHGAEPIITPHPTGKEKTERHRTGRRPRANGG